MTNTGEVDGSNFSAGQPLTLGVLPDPIEESGSETAIRGTVEVVEELRKSHVLYWRMPDGSLIPVRGDRD